MDSCEHPTPEVAAAAWNRRPDVERMLARLRGMMTDVRDIIEGCISRDELYQVADIVANELQRCWDEEVK